MERRRFLGWLAVAASGGLAGCSVGRPSGQPDATVTQETDPSASFPTPRAAPTTPGEIPLPVPKDHFLLAGVKDGIPAITDPAFAADWGAVRLPLGRERLPHDFDFEFEPRLTPEAPVIGVERHGTARAYPLGVLNWFEVVNDGFPTGHGHDEPLLVTYCPLCRTGLVAERIVGGEPTTFGVSGLLYRDNLVLYDAATGSLWSQVRAQAIRGPMTGTRLSLVPSTLTTWAQWRREYPDTVVLLPPPHSRTVRESVVRDVTKSPYGDYDNSTVLGVSPGRLGDERLHPKAVVIGIRSGDIARAYPLESVREAGVVNDVVGDRPVVVAAAEGTLVAYDRRVEGRVRSFERAGPGHLAAAGSRWAIATGRAIDGPHAGTTLASATSVSAMFWFAWLQFNPDTEVWTASK